MEILAFTFVELLLAQTAPSIAPIDPMAFAIQFGFSGLVALILLWFGRIELQRLSAAQDRNTKAVTHLLLALPNMHEQFKASVAQLQTETEKAMEKNPQK